MVDYMPYMSMNIKNKDAHKLARQLARLTGESLTEAVTEAVRERLKRVQNKQAAKLSDRLLEIGQDCATRLKEPFRSADHGDLLYDEKGLPK
jgi:antitoxin VapB